VTYAKRSMDLLPWNIHRRDSNENMSHTLFFVVLIYVPKNKRNGLDLTGHKVERREFFLYKE
jgi:hypothetical protein